MRPSEIARPTREFAPGILREVDVFHVDSADLSESNASVPPLSHLLKRKCAIEARSRIGAK